MFIKNKYFRLYFNIIQKGIQRSSLSGYYEEHHIIPKSFGGSNDSINLVKLTAREHYICHLLLTKCTEGLYKQKMVFAFRRLCNSKNHKIQNSATYEYLRKLHSMSVSQMIIRNGNPGSFGKRGSTHVEIFGSVRSEEIKEKIR